MSDNNLIGTIYLFAGNFIPNGYALCDGTLLPIAENTALFSLIGTTYGGNGSTTFALPNLKSKIPIGVSTNVQLATTTNVGYSLPSELNVNSSTNYIKIILDN